MLDGGNPIDGSALAGGKRHRIGSSSGKPRSSSWKPPTKSNREEHWFTYCRKSDHTKETYFRFHGKDKVLGSTRGFKGIQPRHANQTVSELDIEGGESLVPPFEEVVLALNKAELEHLRPLLDSVSSLLAIVL